MLEWDFTTHFKQEEFDELLSDLEKLERVNLIQKDKVKWVVEADENNKFFQALFK